jgi:hypothetical protein
MAASLPFLFQSAYEMYYLTFTQGQQMIFFSLIHSSSLYLWVVLGSALAFFFLEAYALVVLVLKILGKLGSWNNYPWKMLIVLLIQLVHTVLFITYDSWAVALFPLR